MSSLGLWLYGTRAAIVTSTDRGVELAWTRVARQRWGVGSRVLSHLLPIDDASPHPGRVAAWLAGLLPEGRARSAMAAEHRIDPDDVVAFLAVYGKDTPGAVVFTEPDAPDPATTGWTQPVDDEQIAQLLAHARYQAGSGPTGLESLTSLPGTEPKIALARTAGGWATVHDGAASTHIVKAARDRDSGTGELVDVEAAALDLARRVDLTTITAKVTDFAGVRALVVSRYDRIVHDDGTVERLHQEDLAQALGLNPTDLDRKFQHGRRSPSYEDAARILTEDGAILDDLTRRMVLTVVLGDTDAHAKNLSILREPDGPRVRVAPAYDVAMHMHTPLATGRLALDINGRDRITATTVADLVAEAVSWGLAERRATRLVAGTLTNLRDALDRIDRRMHPGVPTRAWDVVAARVDGLAIQLDV